jgi:MoxR-like ATPase
VAADASMTKAVPRDVPSRIVRPLGLAGWDCLEPVVLAALAAEEPLLLVGAHGSAKSLLLERLAAALGLEFRAYNASLLHFDDLVGVPLPDESGRSLRYIATPTSIWDAEVVFLDELNRTRPELQNKVFPIVHERRVQGVALTRLRHRWAAMNPPPADGDDDGACYLGAEPLDPALADRFAFVVEAPGWAALSSAEQRRVLLDSQQSPEPSRAELRELVAAARGVFLTLQQGWPPRLAEYFVLLEQQRQAGGCAPFSTRRMAMLLRNTLSVQAARAALAMATAGPEAARTIDWETSAWLAFLHGSPLLAQHGTLDRAAMRAFHRQAWKLAGLPEGDPWRELLAMGDPLDRLVRAVRLGSVIGDEQLGQLVLDGVESVGPEAHRVAAALAAYLALHRVRSLPATIVESLSLRVARVLQPVERTLEVASSQTHLPREVGSFLAEGTPDPVCAAYARNLLEALLPDGYVGTNPRAVGGFFVGLWQRLAIGEALQGAA